MPLLELVNSLRDLLREHAVTTVVGSGPDLRVQVGLVNRAARRVLSRRSWSFLQRQDGYLRFPASLGTEIVTNAANPNIILSALSVAQVNGFADGHLSVKVATTGDAANPQTSFIVVNLQHFLVASATLPFNYPGTVGVFNGTVYAADAALPQTVARVLSIRNEENCPVRFETVDSFDDFDRLFPWDAERFSEFPEVVAVGGVVVPTSNFGTAFAPGIGVRIFPPPSANLLLRYSYVYRHPDLALDVDALTGVPAEVQDHVVRVALEDALMSNIEDDPRRGQAVRVQNEIDYRELVSSDRRDAGRRSVPTPFGVLPRRYGWQFARIPEP